jgi:DDE family transposase
LLTQVEQHISPVAAVRMDAGFPEDKLLSWLEQRGTHYVARVRNTSVLQSEAAMPLLENMGVPKGEPQTFLYEWQYQAQGWSRARRAVLVLQQVAGELFPNAFWLVTSWTAEQMPADKLLEHYRQRGTAEGHMGEWMDVLAPALPSAPRPKKTYGGKKPVQNTPSVDAFAHNQVRLLLNALAYNLMHAARTLMEQATGQGWGLARFRERVLKVPARLLLHARRVILVLSQHAAESWQKLWRMLGALRVVPAT